MTPSPFPRARPCAYASGPALSPFLSHWEKEGGRRGPLRGMSEGNRTTFACTPGGCSHLNQPALGYNRLPGLGQPTSQEARPARGNDLDCSQDWARAGKPAPGPGLRMGLRVTRWRVPHREVRLTGAGKPAPGKSKDRRMPSGGRPHPPLPASGGHRAASLNAARVTGRTKGLRRGLGSAR